MKIGPECYLIVPIQLNYELFLTFHNFIVQSYDADISKSFSDKNTKSLTPSWCSWPWFTDPSSLYSDDLMKFREFYLSYLETTFS